MFRNRLLIGLIIAVFSLAGASFSAPPVRAAATAADLDGKPIRGKVIDTMDAKGYTYLQVDSGGEKIWVAIPKTTVKKGQEVVCNPGMVMADFESKSLNRTFKTIVFSSGLGDPSKPFNPNPHAGVGGKGMAKSGKGMSFQEALAAEKGAPAPAMGGAAMGGAAMMASGGSASAVVPSKEISVKKAEGGYTVGECFAKARELNGKKVKIRGKVVKVSRMIMGKNWVHIQDGTGNPMKNTHDLVVTTMAEPAMDSTVLVEGTLHADKDFGAGYRYDAIIEDATIK